MFIKILYGRVPVLCYAAHLLKGTQRRSDIHRVLSMVIRSRCCGVSSCEER